MRTVFTRLAAPFLFVLFAGFAAAGEPVFQRSGAAIHGYDPVAYFEAGEPVKGKSRHEVEWNGAKWRFASAANRDAFQADPERYAPQYGGYCAWAVSRGHTAPIDPKSWKVVDGKLYLNYSKSVQENWEKDIPGHIASADGHWPRILSELSK